MSNQHWPDKTNIKTIFNFLTMKSRQRGCKRFQSKIVAASVRSFNAYKYHLNEDRLLFTDF